MINIPIQFVILLVIIIFPVFIMLFTFESIGGDSFDLKKSYKEMAGCVFLVTMVMLCSIFVYVPCYERGCKMRFILRKLGIKSVKYWASTLSFDLAIALVMCILTFGLISLLFNKTYDINFIDYLDMIWRNLIWLSTFITQSKHFSHSKIYLIFV
jgi:hypothetical protein